MSVYSFFNFTASMVGPGVVTQLGYGAAVAEEGLTLEMEGDKNSVTMGADGEGMHNLHCAKNGTVTIRLLKTSPVNAVLQSAYNAQTINPLLHGQNVILIRDPNRGDVASARQVAFKKIPNITYAKDGGMNEWRFDAIKIDTVLGSGTPAIAAVA